MMQGGTDIVLRVFSEEGYLRDHPWIEKRSETLNGAQSTGSVRITGPRRRNE